VTRGPVGFAVDFGWTALWGHVRNISGDFKDERLSSIASAGFRILARIDPDFPGEPFPRPAGDAALPFVGRVLTVLAETAG